MMSICLLQPPPSGMYFQTPDCCVRSTFSGQTPYQTNNKHWFPYLGLMNITNFSIGSHKGARLQTTPPEHIAAGTTVSTLTILQAEISDSGKYTCLPAQLESASVNLHVLETDLPALMQTSGSSNRG